MQVRLKNLSKRWRLESFIQDYSIQSQSQFPIFIEVKEYLLGCVWCTAVASLKFYGPVRLYCMAVKGILHRDQQRNYEHSWKIGLSFFFTQGQSPLSPWRLLFGGLGWARFTVNNWKRQKQSACIQSELTGLLLSVPKFTAHVPYQKFIFFVLLRGGRCFTVKRQFLMFSFSSSVSKQNSFWSALLS